MEATEMASPIPTTLKRARVGLFVVFLAQGAGFALLVSRMPTIKDRFSLSDSDLSLLTVALPLVAGIATLVTGSLAHRINSQVLLRAAILLEYLALVTIGYADTLAVLLPGWVLMGVAFGTVDATMNMKGVALQQSYGRSIMVGFYAVYSLAGIVGALAASASVASGLSLGLFLTGAAVVLAIPLLATGPWLAAARIQRPTEPATTPTDAQRNRVPWLPVVSIGVVLTSAYFIESSASSWSAVYVHDTIGSTQAVAALAFAGYSAAMLLGRVGADVVIRRLGAPTVVRSSALIALVGTALVVIAPVAPVAILGFALAGLGLCVIAPLAFAAAGRLDDSGVSVARANSFTYVGFLLGAGLIGPIADLSSMRIAYVVPLALSAVVLLNARRIVGPTAAHDVTMRDGVLSPWK
ncbi:MFS transporter [Rhodococcus sp. D2-41]|uniref:MFS transporter n=1 Tax=Speluncibacter jeojiensis TaxID=2710754 RepID=UPI0024108AB9|nr:MFS transporter [Rhodococcus sp. D2-41]MDG3008574.1 MFS transporter [Rhodococcus sp. D2-41]